MSCSILNVSSVRYGGYDVFSPNPVDSAGLVSFRCTEIVTGDLLSIQLSRGDAARFMPRAMRHRGSLLEYNLYLDAARTIVWGDGTSGTSAYTVHPTEGELVSVPIYGRIPPRQNVEIGPYHDDVVLTVLY